MKKLILALLALTLLSVPMAFAGQTGSGCGVGQQIWAGQSGMIMHVLAAGTNGVFSQSSSLTSGTMGCDSDSVLKADHEQEVFMAWNLENVTEDMARGDGQYLRSLSGLMGCQTELYPEFASLTQSKMSTLVDGDAEVTLSNIKRELAADPRLAAGCSRIS